MFILLLTLACLLLLRLPVALYIGSFKDMGNWDSFAHRLFFRTLAKEHGCISHVRVPHYLLDAGYEGPITYPLGYHTLLHGFGLTEKAFDRFGHLLPTLWDALLIGATYAAMRHFGAAETKWLLFLPFQQILTFRIARAFHHSERAFGTLLSNLFFLSAIGILREGFQPVWMLLGVSSVIVATVSSKFAWQTMLLLTTISSLLLRNPIPIYWLLACIAASIVCTGGYAWHVLRGLLSHLRFCLRALLRQANGVSYHTSATVPELFRLARRRQWKDLVMRSCEHACFLIILLAPLTIVAADALWHARMLDATNVWWIAGVIAVLLVSLKPFGFIGRPERYLDGMMLPLVLSLSSVSFRSVDPPAFWLCVLLSALATAISTIAVFWIYNASLRQRSADEAEAIAFLKRLATPSLHPPVLLSIPLWFCTKILLSTEKFRFLSFLGGVSDSRHAEALQILWNWIGIVTPSLQRVVDTYHVRYLVVDRRFEKTINKRYGCIFYPRKPGSVIFENASFEIRSIPG
ncbi:MAG: hypothetical protein V1876_00380 [Candidatus Peregrinibacteria bacterium]